jgi:hypothetical protein
MDVTVTNPYGSYRMVQLSGVELEFDLSEVLDNMSDEALLEQAKERDLYVFEGQDEMITALINDDQERNMLEEMDLGTVIEILGEDEILTEMDDDDILKYAQENNIVPDDMSLDDVATTELVNELMQRNKLDALLGEMDSEMIQAHLIHKRGGFTLEEVPTEEMISCLENERGVIIGGFTVTAGVAQAFRTLAEFCRVIENGSKEGLEGKRFILPTE